MPIRSATNGSNRSFGNSSSPTCDAYLALRRVRPEDAYFSSRQADECSPVAIKSRSTSAALSKYLEVQANYPEDQSTSMLCSRSELGYKQKRAKAIYRISMQGNLELAPRESASIRLVTRSLPFKSRNKLNDAQWPTSNTILADSLQTDANALMLQGDIFRAEQGDLRRRPEAASDEGKPDWCTDSLCCRISNVARYYRQPWAESTNWLWKQFNKVLIETQSRRSVDRPLVHAFGDPESAAESAWKRRWQDIDKAVLEKQPVILAHLVRAKILASMNRLGEAIAETEQVALAAPENVQVKLELALYYQLDKRNNKAIELYTGCAGA